MKRIETGVGNRAVWLRVTTLAMVMFFVYLADGILSDWVPNYMQTVLGSPILMGLVMSFSSLVGFAADVVFPQVLRGITVKKLMVAGIIAGALFAGSLLFTTFRPVLVVILLAMAIWGVYYELLGFASQQFVAETAATNQRSQVWAVLGMFKSLAYFLGPIVGGWLLVMGDKPVVVAAGLITVLSYLIFYFVRLPNRKVKVEIEEINLIKEMSHWWVLLEHLWPVLIISLVLGLIDATFWTTGTVLTESLSKQSWWGGLFLPMYSLPSLFVGLIVLKWGVYQGKKKWAEIFMLLAGLFLAGLAISGAVFWQLLMVFLSGVMLSVTYPLVDAVYSDIVSRMGRERKHLIGLSSSMVSISYIIGPTLAGVIASLVGERATFVAMGVGVAVTSVVLLIVTPRKLRLPQQMITTWGNGSIIKE